MSRSSTLPALCLSALFFTGCVLEDPHIKIQPILCTDEDSDYFPLQTLDYRMKYAEEVYERRLGVAIDVLPLIKGFAEYKDVTSDKIGAMRWEAYSRLHSRREVVVWFVRYLETPDGEPVEGMSQTNTEDASVFISSFAHSDTVVAHELGHWLNLPHVWDATSILPHCPHFAPAPFGNYVDPCGREECRYNVMSYCAQVADNEYNWSLTLSDDQAAVAIDAIANKIFARRE